MKKSHIILLALTLSFSALAQTPEKMSYQAVVKDATNALIKDAKVGIQVSILQGSITGSAVYTETHVPTTNANGLITVEVGRGTVLNGVFSGIDWSAGPYFIKTETDPNGGTNYIISGTQQLLSVPYALYAKTANLAKSVKIADGTEGAGKVLTSDAEGNASWVDPTQTEGLPSSPSTGDIVYYSGRNWKKLSIGQNGQVLTISNGRLVWADPAVLPSVSGKAISSILSFSAQSGGNVLYDGGVDIIARGVCWSTTPNPTIADTKTNNGASIGSYTSSITGLDAGVTYYVRAYATNSSGRTGYGAQYSFTTTVLVAPSISTGTPTNVNSTTIACGGNVTFDGGAVITQRGICYSTTANPTVNDNKVIRGSGTGSFNSQISGLIPGTKYYLRAYAINEAGVSYGQQVTFVPHYIIGERTQGGIVFYLDSTKQHGLVVTASDVSTSASYGCYGVDSKTSEAFGTGQANTNSMIATCPSGTAATICNNLVLNGYSDWFLPSKGEIDVMRNNIGSAANTTYEWYWSSSQKDNNFGWYSWGKAFGNNWSATNKENSTFAVRAVRDF